MRRRPIVLTLAACLLTLAAATAPPTAAPPSGTILVANMSARTVWLIDAETGERRAVVRTREDPHEIAVSSDGRVAAVTNYGSGDGNLVQLIDVNAGTVTGEITIEGYQRLHGAAFLDGDSLLALTSERTGEVLVVDVSTGQIRKRLETLGQASHMLARGGAWIYTANIVDGTVSRVDPDGDVATRTWPAGSRTEGVAATPDGSEGWTGSMEDGTVVGIEGATGREVARVEGLTVPYRLAVTPDGSTVVVSDPESGVLGVIERSSGVLERVDIRAAALDAGLDGAPSPQGFILDPSGRWAFVSTQGIDRVAVVDLESRIVVTFLQAGLNPDGIGFSRVRTQGGFNDPETSGA